MELDTIAAIATPIGEAGLAVIRISGPEAFAVADRCFCPAGRSIPTSTAASHTVQYGHIHHAGQEVDEVLVAVFQAPRTYTREPTVEVSCHGGMLTTRKVLDAVLASGARIAEPGEFTKRAFLNGRLDLAQAEAVADLIHARTGLAMNAAQEQLAGRLSQRINQLRDSLMLVLAHVEAHIDFPDEDIAPDTQATLLLKLKQAGQFMEELLRTANEGQILRRGVRAAIIGRPNVGKSSLLNLLLGHDRAIVSPIPGTTRDTIEETADVRGIPIIFIDTAGLRESIDPIEKEGIRRSRVSLERAELILHVFDCAEPLTEEDRQLMAEFGSRKRIFVLNKSDLPSGLEASALPNDTPQVRLCTLTGDGLEALKDAVRESVWLRQVGGEMLQVMINARHQDALRRARVAVGQAEAALAAGNSLELVAVDLRIGVNAVGEVVGKTTTDDLLDSIFSQFCLGK